MKLMMDLRLQPELHRGLRLNLNSAKSESQTLPKSHIAQWVQSQAQPELHRSLRLKLSSIVVTVCSVGRKGGDGGGGGGAMCNFVSLLPPFRDHLAPILGHSGPFL